MLFDKLIQAGIRLPRKRNDEDRKARQLEYDVLSALGLTVESLWEKHAFLREYIQKVKINIKSARTNKDIAKSDTAGMTAVQLHGYLAQAGVKAEIIEDPDFFLSASKWNRTIIAQGSQRRLKAGTL